MSGQWITLVGIILTAILGVFLLALLLSFAGKRSDGKSKSAQSGGKSSRDKDTDILIEKIQTDITKQYAEHRLKPQMKWYSAKSAKHKKIYLR